MSTGKVLFSFDEKTSLVELSFSAPGENAMEHDAMAEELKQIYEDLISRYKDTQFKVFVDLTNAGLPTKHATEVYVKTLSDKRILKTAFFGISKSIESVINFIIESAGRGGETRFFINKEEALAWLLATT
ncbi:MAG TPA: hypothetical protein VJJ22_01945 [Candidatus Paceibacterota bacterium]